MSAGDASSNTNTNGNGGLLGGLGVFKPWLQAGAVGVLVGLLLFKEYRNEERLAEDRAVYREEIRRQQGNLDRQYEAIRANQESLRRLTESLERMSEIHLRQMKRTNP